MMWLLFAFLAARTPWPRACPWTLACGAWNCDEFCYCACHLWEW